MLCRIFDAIFLLQHFCVYKETLAALTTNCNVEVARYNYCISFILFQAKAIALAAKNGKDHVCVNV